MPFITTPMSDAKEDRPVAEGEYDLRIQSAELEVSKGGNDMVHVLLLVEGVDGASPIHHYLVLPKQDDPNRQLMLRNNKRFLVKFEIPFQGDGFNNEDFPGSVAKVLVKQRTMPESGDVTNVLALPRVKEEGDSVEAPGRRRA